MIDLKFLRENPDIVKQNIKNKTENDKQIKKNQLEQKLRNDRWR